MLLVGSRKLVSRSLFVDAARRSCSHQQQSKLFSQSFTHTFTNNIPLMTLKQFDQKLKNMSTTTAIDTMSQQQEQQENHHLDEEEEEQQTKTLKKSMLYTKTGDRGESSLYNGKRKPKDDVIFEALGHVDEMNAHIGLACEFCNQANNKTLTDKLEVIQSRLLDIGSCIATPIDTTRNENKLRRTQFSDQNVTVIEKWIDELDSELPPLKNFILPSGGLSASQLHVVRTVCRRAERSVVPLVRDGCTDVVVQIYLNRLSDFFFAAARWAAQHDNKTEVIYKKADVDEQ